MTKVAIQAGSPAEARVDLLAALLFEGDKPGPVVEEASGGQAGRVIVLGDFKGKPRQRALLYPGGRHGPVRVLLVGLGPRAKASPEAVRRAVGAAVTEARRLRVRRVGVVGPAKLGEGLDEEALLAAAAEAAVLAGYAFERHKSRAENGEAPAPPLQVTLFGARRHRAAVARAVIVAEATNLARDIANEPGNVATPRYMAEAARREGRAAGFKVKVIEPAEMRRLGMRALLGVAQGSHEPPRFLVLEHAPRRARGKPVVLVGKGLTFDSGGISIKPADKMWEMKFDKCGGCAVIGAVSAAARAKLPVRVIGLVPCTENMPGGGAQRPGDVVRALNGKSIEVLNTDAEGRLILADALSYAARWNPDIVVDVATLTGAVVVALGDVRAAVMSTDEKLLEALRRAGEATGEQLWPLPLDDAYGEHVKGEVADVKNLGRGREAGSVAGGWFLRHFAPKGARWAHLDIAGTAWASSDPGKGYLGKGATGFGVRLLFELLRARAE
jgi:leucyl aminopeptidase